MKWHAHQTKGADFLVAAPSDLTSGSIMDSLWQVQSRMKGKPLYSQFLKALECCVFPLLELCSLEESELGLDSSPQLV